MKYALLATCLASLITWSGCGGSYSDPPGTLQVTWTMGTETCAGLGMATVSVSLYTGDGILFDQGSVACNLRSYAFRNVPPGPYSVEILGYRMGAQDPEYQGVTPPLEVLSGRTSVAEIPIERRPGAIKLRWVFEGGELCGFVGVDTVRITVGQVGTPDASTTDYPCDPLLAQAEAEKRNPTQQSLDLGEYYVAIDGLPAGSHRVIAQGVNTSSPTATQPLYATSTEVVVTYGQTVGLKLELASCDGSVANPACF